MFKRLVPESNKFFILFQETSDCLVKAAESFHVLFHDLNNVQKYVDQISDYEEHADKLTHSTFQLLHKTFITPFDRHDIHNLASGLDDVIDLINRCAQRLPFYALTSVPTEIAELSDLSLKACTLLKQAVSLLNPLKRPEDIFIYCNNIDKLESAAHKAVIAGEKQLFLEENDFKHFFKLKDTYSRTKLVINRCQDVANIIKSIVLEYS
ncbi:MAG: DUF47 domain-containing protein [Gammaproteobacteria bacterium]|nr:DUF47 domain-containing protein [Gammaproteobacteria bacterium]